MEYFLADYKLHCGTGLSSMDVTLKGIMDSMYYSL